MANREPTNPNHSRKWESANQQRLRHDHNAQLVTHDYHACPLMVMSIIPYKHNPALIGVLSISGPLNRISTPDWCILMALALVKPLDTIEGILAWLNCYDLDVVEPLSTDWICLLGHATKDPPLRMTQSIARYGKEIFCLTQVQQQSYLYFGDSEELCR